MEEPLYTPQEVADRLKVTRRTVYTWLKTNQLAAIRAGSGWRVTASALEAFTQQRPQNDKPAR